MEAKRTSYASAAEHWTDDVLLLNQVFLSGSQIAVVSKWTKWASFLEMGFYAFPLQNLLMQYDSATFLDLLSERPQIAEKP